MSRAPVILRIVAPKHRAKRPADSCRHFRSGSQPLSCLPCRREPLPGGKHRAPKHRDVDARVDDHSWAWPCPLCATYAPRHRRDVTA